MENLGKKLMLGGSMAAMVAAISAAAQRARTPEEHVTSSASRLQIQGYEAPTPVTVIGIEQLNRDAKVDIGDSHPRNALGRYLRLARQRLALR